MPHAALSAALARTRLAVATSDETTDGGLLGRFVHSRDEAAFAQLVRRLGPMVLGVCRRVAGDSHLADDAFQAAFLVLARRAADVRPREGVRGWLYGVAVRTAREARTVSARRRTRECPVPVLPDRAADVVEPPDADALRILDEEVAALPDHLRSAVVLCELDGLSRRDAAVRLGVAEGTLSSRLAKARKLLAARLRKRGVVLPASLGTLLAPSSVSARLAAKTSALLSDSVPAGVANLTNGAFRAMYFQKLAACCLVAALVAVCVAASPSPGPTPRLRAAIAPALAPVPPREGKIVVWRKEHAVILKPDGTIVREWKGDKVPEVGRAMLSPDGKMVAALRPYETRTLRQNVAVGGGAMLPGTFSRHLLKVTLYPVVEALNGTDVKLPGDSASIVLWSADGSKLYASTHADDENYSQDKELKHFVIDAKTRTATELKLPAGHHIKTVSPDGNWFVMIAPRANPTEVRPVLLVSADGKKVEQLLPAGDALTDVAFRPDGKRLLVCGRRSAGRAAPVVIGGGVAMPPVEENALGFWFDEIDLTTKKRVAVGKLEERQSVNVCRYSPDGKRIVFFRTSHPPINQPHVPREIVVSDPDGRNEKVLFTDPDLIKPVAIDWR